MKCLVVDDSAIMRPIITEAVVRMGFSDVLEVATGHAALAACASDIDLVITDSSLPDMQTPDFVERIRSPSARGPGPAILVVTTADRLEQVRAALGDLVDGFVLKPFSPGAFSLSIDRVLATRAA